MFKHFTLWIAKLLQMMFIFIICIKSLLFHGFALCHVFIGHLYQLIYQTEVHILTTIFQMNVA